MKDDLWTTLDGLIPGSPGLCYLTYFDNDCRC